MKAKLMFLRHETALLHYQGAAVINLGFDFTSRDSVDSKSPYSYATMPSEVLIKGQKNFTPSLLFYKHDGLFHILGIS